MTDKFAMRGDLTRGDTSPRGKASVSATSWRAYLQNCGVWAGRRALCNARGKVLVDVPVRVYVERFKTPDGEEFVLWKTAVETESGVDEVEEEWSRDELGEFGALTGDGSFSTGDVSYVGERFSVDQCVFDEDSRVRSTFAYDWEGRLTGVVASRERKIANTTLPEAQQQISAGASVPEASTASSLPSVQNAEVRMTSFVEPAAWRSPTVLLDYSVGVWNGRGVVLDARTYVTRKIATRLEFNLETDGVLTQRAQISVGNRPGLIVESSAKLDENTALFVEANMQLMLLPGGVSVSCPIRIWPGISFTLELSFLVRPDFRKRILRCYDENCDWIQTVFISERRVG